MIRKKCLICGKLYKVCPTCEEVKTFSPWRTLVCCAEEYSVYSVLSQYIADKDAAAAMKALRRLGVTKTFAKNNYRPEAYNLIDKIFKEQRNASKKTM